MLSRLLKNMCARDWNRTSTFLRTADFESAASTNSATRAFEERRAGAECALHAYSFSFPALHLGLQCYNILLKQIVLSFQIFL